MFLLFLAYLPCVYLDREALRSAGRRDAGGALCRRLGASGLPGRDAVVVHALSRGDRRLLPRKASRDVAAGAGCSRRVSSEGFPSAARSPASGTCWRLRCTSCTARSKQPITSAPSDRRRRDRTEARLLAVAVPIACALARGGRARGASWVRRRLVNLLLPVTAVCATRRFGSGFAGRAPARRERPLRPRTRDSVPRRACRSPSCSSPRRTCATGSLGDLYTGLFVTPRGRLAVGLLRDRRTARVRLRDSHDRRPVCRARRTREARRITDIAASAVVVALLLLSTAALVGYLTMWYATTSLLPVGVLLGVAALARHAHRGGRARQSPVFLLLALTAFVALVQFPFGAPVYFCFVAPLGVLAWLAMFRHTPLAAATNRIFPTLLLAASWPSASWSTTACSTARASADGELRKPSILDRDRAWIRVIPRERDRLSRDVALCSRRTRRGDLHLRRPGHARDLRPHGAPQPDPIAVRLPRPVELRARTGRSCIRFGAHGVTAIAINRRPAFSIRWTRGR